MATAKTLPRHLAQVCCKVFASIFFCATFGLSALCQSTSAPTVDPIAWQHGGLRGTAVSQYSERYPYPDAGSTLRLKDGSLLHVVNRRERLPELKNSHAHYDPTVIAKVVSRNGGKTWLRDLLSGKADLEPELESYLREWNADNFLVVNIESTPALEALDDILTVPGLDAVQIGPHDLSCSLGIPEQYEHPRFNKENTQHAQSERAQKMVRRGFALLPVGRQLSRPADALGARPDVARAL